MKIGIAEDDARFAEQLKEQLARFAAENRIRLEISHFSDGASLVEACERTFDLILLDIDMPGMDGITAAHEIRSRDSEVLLLFITNLAQYAIRGYEVDALDYVLKPVSYYSLSMKLKKALRICQRRDDKSILLKRKGALIRLPISKLYYIEVYSHSLCYHTAEGRITPNGGQTLNQLEADLSRHGFVRCHNCYLVNLRYVDDLTGDGVTVAGDLLPVSRGRRKALLEALMSEATGGDGL